LTTFQKGSEGHGSEDMEHSLHQVYDSFQDHGTAGSQEGLGEESAYCLDLLVGQHLAAANQNQK